ncbi:MAG TPA: ferredoxin-type protein NapF [Azospirillum sp.]
MADGGFDPGRRRVLFGRARDPGAPVRPPWARRDAFLDLCTRCGACAAACPETIIVAGDGGFPTVDFRQGECTFCGACADACPQPLFDRQEAPWRLEPRIGKGCLTRAAVICQTCRDICPEGAMRFIPVRGAVWQPSVDAARCTGCGACVSACPASAVNLAPARKETGRGP